jgi:hypothetical protein
MPPTTHPRSPTCRCDRTIRRSVLRYRLVIVLAILVTALLLAWQGQELSVVVTPVLMLLAGAVAAANRVADIHGAGHAHGDRLDEDEL